MRETLDATASNSHLEADRPTEEQMITVPIATICSRTGGSRNDRSRWLEKKGESNPRPILDWLEIGDPIK
jgi:hypothetical protein